MYVQILICSTEINYIPDLQLVSAFKITQCTRGRVDHLMSLCKSVGQYRHSLENRTHMPPQGTLSVRIHRTIFFLMNDFNDTHP